MDIDDWLREYETSLKLAMYEGDASRLVAKALLQLATIVKLDAIPKYEEVEADSVSDEEVRRANDELKRKLARKDTE